jgi:hypothetical protein
LHFYRIPLEVRNAGSSFDATGGAGTPVALRRKATKRGTNPNLDLFRTGSISAGKTFEPKRDAARQND